MAKSYATVASKDFYFRWTSQGKFDTNLSTYTFSVQCNVSEVYLKLRKNFTATKIYELLHFYILTNDQLQYFGYPIESSESIGYAVIMSHLQYPSSSRNHRTPYCYDQICDERNLDANPQEFEPKSIPCQQYDLNFVIQRQCVRCSQPFYVTRQNGEYLSEEKCFYHWGKLRIDRSRNGQFWECCRSHETSHGCTIARTHVWTGVESGYNGPFDDYVKTRPRLYVRTDENLDVYALDCEMCFTKNGLEVGKVTVVALNGDIVYQQFIKPDAEVIDYNTRFSGLRPEDLALATKNLKAVQEEIRRFIYAETILIGHGLENDLRALKLLHFMVIDTSVTFPHQLGNPFKNSLKTLARTVLNRKIQLNEHNPAEDARIAVELILTKLKHDFL